MRRVRNQPRAGWQEKVEAIGLTFHSADGQLYWDESAHYAFSAAEIDELEGAANAVHELCLKAAQHVIDGNLFHMLGIPAEIVPLVRSSWEREDFSLYGRFDFAFCPGMPPKLLEYNADTPTALVEAAIAQWYWLQDTHPDGDQFNSIHEQLIASWRRLAGERVHMGGVKDHLEDEQTVFYIADTAQQAGVQIQTLPIDDVGFHTMQRRFVDLNNEVITHYFKLFPWEWMWASEYGPHLKLDVCRFIEPPWKALLANKAILPILWQLFPNHRNLLPAAFSEEELQKQGVRNYVRKPKLSREGANVSIHSDGRVIAETAGEYGESDSIFQAFAPLGEFEGNHPVCGVWIINDAACGLGIREDKSLITGNSSRFIPHLIK